MILYSEEQYKEMQALSVPEMNKFISEVEGPGFNADRYDYYIPILSEILKVALIGKLQYNYYLDWTSSILEDTEKAVFFTQPHTKAEVYGFLLRTFQS